MAEPTFPDSQDLDGIYVWLGPVGAASRVEGEWDSTFGGEITVARVAEGHPLAVGGSSFGASRWSERGGGRLWLDAVVGTRIADTVTCGFTAGPIVELDELEHPRIGGSIGVWAFAGITPFARIGAVDELGVFGELGVHLALPVWRH